MNFVMMTRLCPPQPHCHLISYCCWDRIPCLMRTHPYHHLSQLVCHLIVPLHSVIPQQTIASHLQQVVGPHHLKGVVREMAAMRTGMRALTRTKVYHNLHAGHHCMSTPPRNLSLPLPNKPGPTGGHDLHSQLRLMESHHHPPPHPSNPSRSQLKFHRGSLRHNIPSISAMLGNTC